MRLPFRAVATLLLLVCAFSSVSVSPSEARKKIVSLGCTFKQVDNNDPKLRACFQKQDNDVVKGKPFLHVVACMGGLRYCCKSRNSDGYLSECEAIDRWAPAVGGVANPVVPPLDPGPRTYNGPNNPQKPTTATPH
jgi:hypothetical protein